MDKRLMMARTNADHGTTAQQSIANTLYALALMARMHEREDY